MRKVFLAVLFAALFVLLLCISGCYFPNSGGMFYGPPKKVICDKPWDITVKYYVIPVDPKQRHGKLIERIKDGVIYIHYSSDNNFIAVPMTVESVNPEIGELQMKANMKPISCESGIEYVGYCIGVMFDSNYNRSKYYIVPVSRN